MNQFAQSTWTEALVRYEEKIGTALPSMCDQPAWEEYQRDLRKLGNRLDIESADHREQCIACALLAMMENALSAGKAFAR